jgi:hypothetical protein
MLWECLDDAFSGLSGCNDGIFKGLWLEDRLKFGGHKPSELDRYSARLVCAALRHRSNLFIVLPDAHSSRSPLLFATALIRAWFDLSEIQESHQKSRRQKILYFGSTIGVRKQLAQVSSGYLNLSNVFQQENIGRRQKVGKITQKYGEVQSRLPPLPEVITIYSPVDPIGIIEQHQPSWLAIDCGEAENLLWLKSLLEYAREKRIPVLGWGQNPLSLCVREFSENGPVFQWASLPPLLVPPPRRLQPRIHFYLSPDRATQVQPTIIQGGNTHKLVTTLSNIHHLLVDAIKASSGRFSGDAIRVHWQYLKALESLIVPYEMNEAEATQIWGLRPLQQLSDECEQFRRVCHQSNASLAAQLEQVASLLSQANEYLIQSSPLWQALQKLIQEKPTDGEIRLIVFPSRAKKRLCLLALLARVNMAEEELRARNIWIVSISELNQLSHKISPTSSSLSEALDLFPIDKTLCWHPIIIGLPNRLSAAKLLPALLQHRVDFLLFEHQLSALNHQVKAWEKQLSPNLSNVTAILNGWSSYSINEPLPLLPARLNLVNALQLSIDSTEQEKLLGSNGLLWEPNDPVVEVVRLLESENDLVEDDLDKEEFHEESDTESSTQVSWCQDSIQVNFENDWQAIFASDTMIEVAVQNMKGWIRERRYIRALKPNDRVVIIPVQQRQNLYDLILSRVHGHESIELHLSLIRRWQSDFALAYQQQKNYGAKYSANSLLKNMRSRGSNLKSELTIKNWLSGQTLAPDNAEDLKRLAEILKMDFVLSNYEVIDRAAKRIRGLHRGLSRRLNVWLSEQLGGNLNSSYGSEIIDHELGLTFDDFRNSLLILQVQRVENITGLFLRSNLGKFEKLGQND